MGPAGAAARCPLLRGACARAGGATKERTGVVRGATAHRSVRISGHISHGVANGTIMPVSHRKAGSFLIIRFASVIAVAFFFCFSRILNQCNVTQKLERASPQKLAQSNLHQKAVSKRFSKVENFEFEFPTIFRLHNGIFKFSNFENRFFERRIPQRTDQVP